MVPAFKSLILVTPLGIKTLLRVVLYLTPLFPFNKVSRISIKAASVDTE